MTSTRTGARLPQSNMTGLGAVGGPQGVAAGGLRVILEFLTQYDPSAVKQLESDLSGLKSQLTTYNAQMASLSAKNDAAAKKSQATRNQILEADAQLSQRKFQRELGYIQKLYADPKQRAAAQTRLDALATEVANTLKLSKTEETRIRKLLANELTLTNNKAKQAALQALINSLVDQQTEKEAALSRFQQLKQGIGGRLGSLAVGAIGATIGGTILAGTVFMAMQTAVEAIGTAITENVIDPTKKAREAMTELGQAINSVGEATDSDTAKVSEWLSKTGISVDENTRKALEAAAAYTRVQAGIEALRQTTQASNQADEVKKKQIEDLANALADQDKASGNLVQTHVKMGYSTALVTDKQYYLNKATEMYLPLSGAAANAAEAEARSKLALEQANNRAAFAQDYLNSQLQAGIGRAEAAYDARIGAVPTESARTRRIQSQIERAQGGGGRGNSAQLANIAEERALTLLRMRLRELGTAINIEKYEGKFRLEAINAKIRALQKEGEAQERVNKLLDLQYRMSKEIKREQGESIKDYLERRAQENRSMLAERDQLKRDAQIARLNDQKERLEDEVKLRELAEQAKQAAMQGTENAYLKSLQKQLEASKKRDEKEAAARKKALEKEKKDLVDAANDAMKIATAEQTATWKTTLWGMDNIQDLNKYSGYLQGLYRGKSALEALVKGWGVPSWVADPYLKQINAQIAAYNAQKAKLMTNAYHPPTSGVKVGLAQGGVLLNNASTPFGSNIQFGEQGQELGIVLSNRVTDQLRRMNFPQQIGPFMIQGSGDPLRDQFAFKRLVKEAVAEVLR